MNTVSTEHSTIEVTPPIEPTSMSPKDRLLESHRASALAKLFDMADFLYHHGEVRRSMSIFFKLMNEYPESSEAEMAYARLIEVASQYEHEGELRLAQSIYEELL